MILKTLVLLLFSILALGHGSDKLGPHQGYIQMPGLYHTEVVVTSSTELKVYLLDIDWLNPTTKHSSLEVSHKAQTITKALCQPQFDYFTCSFNKRVDLTKKGLLSISSSRANQQGTEVIYELPLRLKD